jgi:hypothetical protein
MQLVGYKLVDGEGNTLKSWGGIWGQVPSPPDRISLPNGDQVHAPSVDGVYGDYTLVGWYMEEPAPSVPQTITRRQCALQLRAMGTITLAEAKAMTKSAEVPAAVAQVFAGMTEEQRDLAEIDFAAGNYYRDNPLLAMMGLTPEQLNQFFIAAAQL